MRNLLVAASAAALAISAVAACGPASAFQTIIGGMAGQCSTAAKAGRFDQAALELCTMAILTEPLDPHDRAGTLVNRGAMKLRNRDWSSANADFDAALKLFPQMGEAHIGRGAYLISQERYAAAEPELTQGIQLGSEEPEKGYYFRGIARWGQDDFKGAYFDFRKANALKPGWSLPLEQLAYFKVTPAG